MAQVEPKISASLIERYSAGPSANRSVAVKSLHENIRSALENWGDKKFDTFLQGSYRNGTAIADINDVDIVALYDPWFGPETHARWEWLFNHVAEILRKTALVSGHVSLGDKCVKLEGSLNADIVPTISRTAYSTVDPVIVYSRRERAERPNYPRTHYDNGVAKQRATKDAYKPTVRLFKRWKRQYEHLDAPSFYVECAVHSVASTTFTSYLPFLSPRSRVSSASTRATRSSSLSRATRTSSYRRSGTPMTSCASTRSCGGTRALWWAP